MSQHEYTVPLVLHEDGTLAIHDGDIRGLVIEAATFDEMREELLRLAPRLLRSNHGLTDEEVGQTSLRMVISGAGKEFQPVANPRAHCVPKLLWEDDPRIMAGA